MKIAFVFLSLFIGSFAQAKIEVSIGNKRVMGGWNCKVTCSDGSVHLIEVNSSSDCQGESNVLNLSDVCAKRIAPPKDLPKKALPANQASKK
jgi:hypothetical protein